MSKKFLFMVAHRTAKSAASLSPMSVGCFYRSNAGAWGRYAPFVTVRLMPDAVEKVAPYGLSCNSKEIDLSDRPTSRSQPLGKGKATHETLAIRRSPTFSTASAKLRSSNLAAAEGQLWVELA
ncbi:hypothetical protein [Paraburkholderia kirstenboschensis]|uniref:Secreted protein n=1 Tax=Paraburkholderia kirstenboschensis TaxID=1245436 RepID=A0ABZ0E998_9BURK|nr:hypothetical protein [Paraburkholderia kirstenboschensis]WOD13825.1 hypothetical protein RW095_07745 [Paraburkholderia kirstenboschensis]